MENWREKGDRRSQRRSMDDFQIYDSGWTPPTVSYDLTVPTQRVARPVSNGLEMDATVKWFNAEKGFGFVDIPGVGDVFIHISALQKSGFQAVNQGDMLRVMIAPGQKGQQVTDVVSLVQAAPSVVSSAPRPAAMQQRHHAPARSALRQMTGTVKWFNTTKGFGFIAPNDGSKDVFVHLTALRNSGISAIVEGQLVTMMVEDKEKGPEAISLS